jgi:phosphopantothenoylcysteine decarboxylase/phosphopantothenate--cysteine ligase
VTFVENPDVARALGEKKRPGQVLVAFAAETGANLENAREKRLRKNADLIVFNDVLQPGAGFDADTNIVTLIDARGEEALPQLSKRAVADRILSRALTLCDTAG